MAEINSALSALPVFSIPSSSISILGSPSEFYSTLISLVKSSKKRIVLSALYIGHDQIELVEALEDALIDNKDLEVVILMDYFRGSRTIVEKLKNSDKNKSKINASVTNQLKSSASINLQSATSKSTSSIHLVSSLKLKFNSRVTLALFRTPDSYLLQGLLPQRFNEGLGLMHVKAFVFDGVVVVGGCVDRPEAM